MAAKFENFKPTLWRRDLLMANQKKAQYRKLCNEDTKITNGNTAIINQIVDVIVDNYVSGSGISVQQADTTSQTFILDQQKYFAYSIDVVDGKEIVDEPQVRAKLMANAGYQLADVEDIYIASKFAKAGIFGADLGVAATPIYISLDGSGVTPIEYITEVMAALDTANVTDMSRRMVLPNWFKKLLVREMKEVNNVSGDAVLKTGVVQDMYGIECLFSNNVHNAANKYDIMACVPEAISFARSINYLEAFKVENGFGSAVKGLTKYGCKVTKAASLAHGVITDVAPVVSE